MTVTVQDFIQECRDKIPLKLLSGDSGLSRRIAEPAIHRPGLALAGAHQHFPVRQIQTLGMAEMKYLTDLPAKTRASTLNALFKKRIPCVVLTRNKRASQEITRLSEQYKVPVLRTPLITWQFLNSATSVLESLMAPTITVQGTTVDIMGIGVLMEGRPRVGKSEAALALVQKGYSLVADDVTVLRRDTPTSLVASAKANTRYHIEIRGLGIIHIPSLFGVAAVRAEKGLDLIVTLRRIEEMEDNGWGLVPQSRTLLGVSIPHITLPVAPGRELANIVETATLNEKLKRLGHDAAKELDEKLMRLMSKGSQKS